MPTIPYPAVPAYPGVPDIPRVAQGSPAITMNLGTALPASVGNMSPVWGIFSAVNGNPLFTPRDGGTLSTYAFEYSRQTVVATYPAEEGSFVSYDKVWTPAGPAVTLTFDGSESDKKGLLSTLDAACLYPVLWNVFTPDAEYDNYTIQRYSYRRMATKSATMLLIDVFLEEIKQVALSYASITQVGSSVASPAPIASPKPPSAVAPVSSGQVQPSPPSPGILQKAALWLATTLGMKPPPSD